MINLRPYQQQLITDIRLQYQLGHKSVLAVLPTGGGKTVCFSYIAQQASIKGNRVCVLVHRAELLDQASRSMPVPHGRISAGKSMDLSHTVQVASVQTLARRLHLLPRDFFQLLIIDEAHHTSAGTWAKVIQHFHAAKLLGVTATPIRSDGRGLGEHYQAMVQGPTAQQLTEQGFLAAAKVLAPPGFDSTGLRKRMGDFDPKEAEQRVGTIMGDCLGHYRKHLPGQTAIAFCCSVAHAEAVSRLFNSNGVPAASIDGSMDSATRRELLDRLAVGDLKVLTSCALIGEGVDVPSVGGCILLRPTASVALHLQMIGRCLRPQPGKRAVVLDHVGNTLRLGHHLEPRDWSLDGVARRDREQAPSCKVCPACFATSASTVQVCRECGHVFAPQERRELQQVDGELVEKALDQSWLRYRRPVEVYFGSDEGWMSGFEVSRYSVEKVNGQWIENTITVEATRAGLIGPGDQMEVSRSRVRPDSQGAKREQGSAQSLQDLIALGQQRGYKNPAAWAKHVLAARQTKGQWSKIK
jgi:DNA repair protein RadD